jgi:hypothetical protein
MILDVFTAIQVFLQLSCFVIVLVVEASALKCPLGLCSLLHFQGCSSSCYLVFYKCQQEGAEVAAGNFNNGIC